MTRSELRALLKRLLGSPLPATVRDADSNTEDSNLNAYLNDAQREMAGHVGGVAESATITLVDGTRLYDFPARLLQPRDVRHVRSASNERSLEEIEHPQDRPINYRTATGDPSYYYIEGQQFGFYFVPGADQDGDAVRVDGWFEPQDLSADDSEPSFDRALHRAIAILAAALICEAQARAEAQSSNVDIAADSVVQDSRSRVYRERAVDLRKLYNEELARVGGLHL